MSLAIVTGANRGLGRETVRELAKRGYRCWLTGRDAEAAAAAARELAGAGLDVRSGETFTHSMTMQPKAELSTTPPAVSAAPAPSVPPVPHRTQSSTPALVSSPASSASSPSPARPRIQMIDERDSK